MSKKFLVNLYNRNKKFMLKVLLINLILTLFIIFFFKTYNQDFSKTEVQIKYKINLVKNFNQLLSEFYFTDFDSILEKSILNLKEKLSYDTKNFIIIFKENGSLEIDFNYITRNKNKDSIQNFRNISQKEILEIKSTYKEIIKEKLSKYYIENKKLILSFNKEMNDKFIQKNLFDEKDKIFENDQDNTLLYKIIDLNNFLYQTDIFKTTLTNNFMNSKYDIIFNSNYEIISLIEVLTNENQINKLIKINDQFFILILMYLSSITIVIYRIFGKK